MTKPTNPLRKAIGRYTKAKIEFSWIGSKRPEEAHEVKLELLDATRALRGLLDKLDSHLENS
jgi:hypothetical protein